MANIGGKTIGILQAVGSSVANEIGEREQQWEDVFHIWGWLGLQNGDSKYQTHKAKIEESTHVFLCDYNSAVYAMAGKDTRMILKGFVYDVLLIDNPDEMDEQLEIYLRRVGAWDGK